MDGTEYSAGAINMKLHVFTIDPNAEKTKLFSLTKRMLPELPEYALREAFQKRDVKVNGQRVGLDAKVVPGAEVKIYTRDLATKQSFLSVVYEDENILVVNKPSGISCEKDAKGGKTLTQQIYEQKPELVCEPLLCHRLDNPTEGLLLLAKNELVQLEMQEAFRKHQVYKEYTCLVLGIPKPEHAVLHHFLIKDAKHASVRVTSQNEMSAKPIVTEYFVLKSGECSRLRIRLHTGRTHQIRAHMAFVGHPLLGDDQYGDREANKYFKARKLMLCSSGLSFELIGRMSYLNEKTFSCQPSF